MHSRVVVSVLCAFAIMVVACNPDANMVAPISKSNPNQRPSAPPFENDLILISPHLQFVPCGSCVGISWRLTEPVKNCRVDIKALYCNGEEVLLEQDIVWNFRGTNHVTWTVPDIRCSETILQFRVRGSHIGSQLIKSFDVGPTHPRQSHGELEHVHEYR